MKLVKTLLLFIGITSSLFAQESTIKNWEFAQREFGGIWEVWRNVRYEQDIWENVEVPHSFNSEDAVDPDKKYYQGEGWYKTGLDINNPYKYGRTLLHFEGVGQQTTLYVYQQKIGTHVGGYDEFTFDITKATENFKKDNLEFPKKYYDTKVPIAVNADNSRDLNSIPSDLSDFNLYGGIYRKVHLKYVPAISLSNIRIESSLHNKRALAKLSILPTVYNPSHYTEDLTYSVEIKDPNGKIINNKIVKTKLSWAEPIDIQIEKPLLWSSKTPNIYTCTITVESRFGKHQITETFGLRDFEFKQKGPFYLNGKRLLLRGTHRHEDHAGVAAAMTDDQIRREFALMKEMGVNFIRLGHYQQSELVLDLCDSLGILVWEEIPWCRSGAYNTKHRKQIKSMLHNMITQHYNHPSVIIWGIGNENDWTGDAEVIDTIGLRNYMKEMHNYAHILDNKRKTAIRRVELAKDIVDVYSPSIWAGWYRGVFTEYKNVSQQEMEKVNYFFHAEWGASHFTYRHSENPDRGIEAVGRAGSADEREGDFLLKGGDARVSKDGDWSTTYACNLIDWHLKEQETMPWLTGTAYWPFKDFSTPVRPENPIPYVNQKGVLERDFTKKESYYVFQSYWAKEPMVHIYGSTWEKRWGDTNEKKLIKVYSNCKKVELFVNGISQGIKKRNSQNYPAAGLRWNVQLNDGDNSVKAIGIDNGIEHEINIHYQTKKWGKPSKLALKTVEQKKDSVLIEARLFDENGIQILDAIDFVLFDITGDGKLLDKQGTSRGSRRIALANGKASIWVKKNKGISMFSVKLVPKVGEIETRTQIAPTFLKIN